MASSRGTFSVAAAFLLQLAYAQMRVLGPAHVAKEFAGSQGRIQGSTATFGAPFYGDRVLGRLVWGRSKGHHHCEDSDYEIPPLDVVHRLGSKAKDQVRLINIVMVRRGECSFVTKVKVASAKGAHAVIIVDREDSTLTSGDLQNIIVADDGFGGRIKIPSILISRFDGDPLIAALERAGDEHVIVELSWDIPRDEVVSLDLWMNSAAHDSQNFLKGFTDSRKTLNEVVEFTPHYHVFSADPTLSGYSGLCSDSSARYCSEDPDGAGPVSGKDVLEEDVRQLCIHEITKVPRSRKRNLAAQSPAVFYAEQWWNYVEQLPQRCPVDAQDSSQRFGKQCSERLMADLGIPVSRVQHCVDTTTKQKLESELVNKAWSPRALRVNGWRYSGTLEADLVTRAVCSGFVNQPDECKALTKPRDPTNSNVSSSSGLSMSTLIGSAIALTSVLFCMLLFYRRFLEKQMGEQIRLEVQMEVRGQLDDYVQI